MTRKQINITINPVVASDADAIVALQKKADEWGGIKLAEAAKRVLVASLETPPVPSAVTASAVMEVSKPVVSQQEYAQLLSAMLAMTQELVALRLELATMRNLQAQTEGRTSDVSRRSVSTPVPPEASLNLNPKFVDALKKAARPGMSLDGDNGKIQ